MTTKTLNIRTSLWKDITMVVVRQAATLVLRQEGTYQEMLKELSIRSNRVKSLPTRSHRRKRKFNQKWGMRKPTWITRSVT